MFAWHVTAMHVYRCCAWLARLVWSVWLLLVCVVGLVWLVLVVRVVGVTDAVVGGGED